MEMETPETGLNTYVRGREGGLFLPEESATRAELAVMLARLSPDYDPETAYPSQAKDVEGTAWYANYVNFAAEKGFVSGYEDGTFRPNRYITRGEFSAMLCRYLQLPPRSAGGFTDLEGCWAEGYINALQRAGVVPGFGDSAFRPNGLLTRAEAVTMINRAVGLVYSPGGGYAVSFADVSAAHWAYQSIMAAANTDVSLILK